MTKYIQPDDTLNIYYRVSDNTITDIVTIEDEEDNDVTSALDNLQNAKKIQGSPDEEHINEKFTFDIDGFGTKEIVVNEIPNSEDGDDIDEITINGTEYRVHTFKNDGTFTIDKNTEVDILIVGGGGGGGGDAVTYNRTSTSRNGATEYKDIAKDVGAGGSATDSDARDENSAYGNGGSGIVIIRYVIE